MRGISEYFKSLHVFSFGSYYLVELQWSLAYWGPVVKQHALFPVLLALLLILLVGGCVHILIGYWSESEQPFVTSLSVWAHTHAHLCLCTWQYQCPGSPETESRGPSVLFVRQSLLLTWNSLSWLVWFEFLLSSGSLLSLSPMGWIIGIQCCLPGILIFTWGSNSGPHTYMAKSLPTDLPPFLQHLRVMW